MRLVLVCLFVLLAAVTAYAEDQVTPVETEHFIYHLTTPKLLPQVDSALAKARTKLIGLLADSLDYKPDVYVVDDLAHFENLIGGKFPDWGAAAAVPVRRLIAIKSPAHFNVNRPLDELLAHEYSHLALAHRTGFYAAPRWFDEGLAMFASMEWSWSDNLAMSKAAVFRQLLTLDTIELVNRFNEGQAHVAYATSYQAVAYLYKQYGGIAVNQMLDSIAHGRSMDIALFAATGSNYRDFEKEFRVYLDARFNATSLLADTMYFWLALAFVLILGAYLQYRRRRSYYKKWEREEKYESKDFDYGDPDDPEKPDDDDEPWRK
jgi:hypothetical protein